MLLREEVFERFWDTKEGVVCGWGIPRRERRCENILFLCMASVDRGEVGIERFSHLNIVRKDWGKRVGWPLEGS